MPARVDRHEGFLQQVFRLRWTVADARKSLFEIAAQMTAQPLEKRPMSRSITIEAGYHQRSELLFVGMSGFVHWLRAVNRYLIPQHTPEMTGPVVDSSIGIYR
jgi:hypothetical protein